MDKMQMPKPDAELKDANFSAELCADACRFMADAIQNRDAYVINNSLVLKMARTEEAFHLGIEDDSAQLSYGLRVALCVKDAAPFRRGEWYTTSSPEVRKAIIEHTQGGLRAVSIPIEPTDWKIIKRIAAVNKSPELLEKAARYALSLNW